MNKTLHINLDSQDSRNKAIAELTIIANKLDRLEEFLNKLSGHGVAIAQDSFDQGILYNPYGGDYGTTVVTVENTDNGFIIHASGKQVVFEEFGAGVSYSGQAYEGQKPSGIDAIGTYVAPYPTNLTQVPHGNRRAWGYYDNPEQKEGFHITRGVPALQGMYNAKKYIMEETRQFFEDLIND